MTAKTWRRIGDGVWAVDANWSPAAAPTASDDVTLTGPSAPAAQTITGPGASASLAVLGSTVLRGSFSTGALRQGTLAAPGSLGLVSGATLDAATLAIVSGTLSLAGAGTRATFAGAATLGGTAGTGAYAAAITVTGGAALRTGPLALLPADSQDRITVDATSSFEVGSLGNAAAGTLTVDPGQTLSGAGSIAAAIRNDGTIIAQSGTLTLAGGSVAGATLTGTGRYEVAAGATLALATAATGTVSFTGAGATLILSTAATSAGTRIAATGRISGYDPSDVIAISSVNLPISAVTWSAATGQLAFASGSTQLGSIALAGDYTGYAFQVTPNGQSSALSNVVLAPVGSGTQAPGTTTPDAYVWRSIGSGAWNAAGNWTDTSTASTPAGIAPGTNNAVTLQGPAANTYQVVTGPGAAASLVALGRSSLAGAVAAGPVTIGSTTTAGALNIAVGASLSASALTILNGPLQVTGPGARLSVAGALTIGGTLAGPYTVGSDTLTIVAGAAVQVAGLALLPGRSFNAVSVDAASTLEVGTASRAAPNAPAPGTFTIDPDHQVAGTGSVAGTIVNDGIILAQGGTLSLSVSGTITGAGSLQIDAGATLSLSGPANQPVLFRSGTGTLQLTSYYGLGNYVATPVGVIAGFRQGDAITVTSFGTVMTSVRWQQTAATQGSLTLLAGQATLGTLTLAGDLRAAVWSVGTSGGSSATVTATLPAQPGAPLFDPDYYRLHNLDVAIAGIDPLQHYQSAGWKEARDPSAAFDTADYLAANPDVKAAGIDPLRHYTTTGQAEGRAAFAVPGTPPDPLVDAAYYYAHNPDVRAAGLDASAHFHATGWREGRIPDGLFDPGYYLAQNPDVKAAGIDPLLHYEQSGWKEGRAPSLLFDGNAYLNANADVAAAGLNPLQHYFANGRTEGRPTFLTGGLAAADPLVDAAYYDRQLGATLLPAGAAAQQQASWSYDHGGWQKGLNPDMWFDTAYYLAHNADVAAAHVDPLLHFESSGWHEGRDPSAQFSTTKYLAAYADVRNAGIDPLLHYVAFGQAEGRAIFTV